MVESYKKERERQRRVRKRGINIQGGRREGFLNRGLRDTYKETILQPGRHCLCRHANRVAVLLRLFIFPSSFSTLVSWFYSALIKELGNFHTQLQS